MFAEVHSKIGGFHNLELDVQERVNLLNERINSVVNGEGRAIMNLSETPTKFEEEELPSGPIPSNRELTDIKLRINQMKDEQTLNQNKKAVILFDISHGTDDNKTRLSNKTLKGEEEYVSLIDKIKNKKDTGVSLPKLSKADKRILAITMGSGFGIGNNKTHRYRKPGIESARTSPRRKLLSPEISGERSMIRKNMSNRSNRSCRGRDGQNSSQNTKKYKITARDSQTARIYQSHLKFTGGGGNFMLNNAGSRGLFSKTSSLPFLEKVENIKSEYKIEQAEVEPPEIPVSPLEKGIDTGTPAFPNFPEKTRNTSRISFQDGISDNPFPIPNTGNATINNNLNPKKSLPRVGDISTCTETKYGTFNSQKIEQSSIFITQKDQRTRLYEEYGREIIIATACNNNYNNYNLENNTLGVSRFNNTSLPDQNTTSYYFSNEENINNNSRNINVLSYKRKLKEETASFLKRVQSLGELKIPYNSNLNRPQFVDELTYKNKYLETLVAKVKYLQKRENQKLTTTKHNLFRMKK